SQELVRITGTVRDAENEPLPGVSILIRGTKGGTQADSDGKFSLNAAPGATLVFKFLGYETQEVKIENQTTINVKLNPESRSLQEVVVSYGTQKKREVTGSIATVSAAPLQDMPVGQFAQQLQGKVPGVQISQSSGQPGRGMEF